MKKGRKEMMIHIRTPCRNKFFFWRKICNKYWRHVTIVFTSSSATIFNCFKFDTKSIEHLIDWLIDLYV
jgi:hypothetical protein